MSHHTISPSEPLSTETPAALALNHRERATLQAVSLGRTEMSCSAVPDLFIDGVSCCDQATVRQLAGRGLITPVRAGQPGERVPAQLTDAGQAALNAAAVHIASA